MPDKDKTNSRIGNSYDPTVTDPNEMFDINPNAGPKYGHTEKSSFGHRSLHEYDITSKETHVSREIKESKWFNTRTWLKSKLSLEKYSPLGPTIKETARQEKLDKHNDAVSFVIEQNPVLPASQLLRQITDVPLIVLTPGTLEKIKEKQQKVVQEVE